MSEHDQPMTPLAAAKDLIRPYVRRGESIDALASSRLGAINGRYRATIEHDQTISVVVVGGDGATRRVPLHDTYTGVRNEQTERPGVETVGETPIGGEPDSGFRQARLF